MATEQTTELGPKGWIAEVENLPQRLTEAGKKLHSFRNVTGSEFDPQVNVDRNDFFDTLLILFSPTPEELEKAPQAIKMVLEDLGLSQQEEIKVKIILNEVAQDPKWHHNFNLTLGPNEVTADKIGISLSSLGGISVFGPTTKRFDGIHQYVNAFYGRGAHVNEIYVGLGSVFTGWPHPFMAEILSSGADWITDILNNRRKPS
jgi:hypothetical protein